MKTFSRAQPLYRALYNYFLDWQQYQLSSPRRSEQAEASANQLLLQHDAVLLLKRCNQFRLVFRCRKIDCVLQVDLTKTPVLTQIRAGKRQPGYGSAPGTVKILRQFRAALCAPVPAQISEERTKELAE